MPAFQFTDWVRRYVTWIVPADLAIALVCGAVALLLRFGTTPGAAFQHYLLVTAVFPLALVGTFALTRCYEPRFLGDGAEEFRRLGTAAVRFTAVFAILAFAFQLDFARGYAFVSLPLTVALCALVRVAARLQLTRARRAGSARRRVVVLGTERASAEMIRELAAHGEDRFEVVGVLTAHHRSDMVEGVPVVGSPDDVRRAVELLSASTVMVAPWSPVDQSELRRLSWQIADLDTELVISPNLTDVVGARLHIQPYGTLPLLHVEQPEFTGVRRVLKSALDRLVAMVGLLLLSPVLLATAAVIRLTSDGPAFFGQTRVGRDGKAFTMYKFRSMYVDAEQRRVELESDNPESGPLFKLREDPRITRVGRFIRRYSIDELPQLLNVVKGDMAMVGPRPPLPAEVAEYAGDVHRRLKVRPGLTGLWQVSGRSDLSWDESVRLDLHYVENWSVFSDLAIMARTASAVLRARGAY
jgi:exopolysaccharide biosynthesis polyprenyl glycosylphosphotransferase